MLSHIYGTLKVLSDETTAKQTTHEQTLKWIEPQNELPENSKLTNKAIDIQIYKNKFHFILAEKKNKKFAGAHVHTLWIFYHEILKKKQINSV